MKDIILSALNILCGLMVAVGFVSFVVGAGCIDHPDNLHAIAALIVGGMAVAVVGGIGTKVIAEIERR